MPEGIEAKGLRTPAFGSGRCRGEKVELWLARKRVVREIADRTLGSEFERADRAEIQSKVDAAEQAVWAGYRFAVVADAQEADGLKIIDLGAGHSSSGETLASLATELPERFAHQVD